MKQIKTEVSNMSLIFGKLSFKVGITLKGCRAKSQNVFTKFVKFGTVYQNCSQLFFRNVLKTIRFSCFPNGKIFIYFRKLLKV